MLIQMYILNKCMGNQMHREFQNLLTSTEMNIDYVPGDIMHTEYLCATLNVQMALKI